MKNNVGYTDQNTVTLLVYHVYNKRAIYYYQNTSYVLNCIPV